MTIKILCTAIAEERREISPESESACFRGDLKRVAIFQIRSMRFRFLVLRMSLSRNRFPLSGDML
ncbi:hypothetical protein DPM35_25880 [Mesorhizobium atlanticum]|uniref:Uncharacterized protein n=1 Tax=Mesorhizobium atlanticum TaxID=2233532 RepID=A0A330GJA0_9HYPH|nr:hypothetical protein DPM35_25880 [Mesorhizobium atlanticum]